MSQCTGPPWVGPRGGGVQHRWPYCPQAGPPPSSTAPPPHPPPPLPGGTTHRAMKGDSVPGGSAGEEQGCWVPTAQATRGLLCHLEGEPPEAAGTCASAGR